MRFYNREEELKELKRIQQLAFEESSRMTVVTGRRRIGKTSLIMKAVEQTPTVYLFIGRKNEATLCEEFIPLIAQALQIFVPTEIRSFRNLFQYLMQLSTQRTFNLVIDEFQEFYTINESIFSDMQNIWDQYRKSSHMNLIVSGSIYSLMQKIFQDNKEPLFGRADNIIKLSAFSLSVLKEIMHEYAPTHSNDDLLALSDQINAAGIVPVAMDGGDGWVLACYMQDLMVRIAQTPAGTISDAIANGDFSDPLFSEAAQLLADTASAGVFQTGFDYQDYGTAQNLFTNGQAAMFYMGSWETSMALNEDIPEEVRDNIRAFVMPAVADGKGTATDLAAWNGGGYAVSADSKVKDEAIKFLNYMYQPDQLSKLGWEFGVGLSAQDQTDYLTGEETRLQMQIMDLLNNATNISGTPINDCGSSNFKTTIETEIQSLANGTESTDDFLSALGNACK